MSHIEIYLFLLADSFMSGLVLPVKYKMVFPAMLIFGGYNIYIISLVSSLGVTLAACANYILGKMLLSLKKESDATNQNPKVLRLLIFVREYGYFAALFGFIPVIGPILLIFTGVFQTNFLRVISLIFMVNLFWHSMQ